jgi:transcriptional regulator with GAF, ATPase, and Fis domain
MLLEISKALAQVNDISELLPMIVDMAVKVSGAERGFIMMVHGPEKIEFSIGRNKNKESLRQDAFAFSKSVTDTVLEHKKLVSITDTASDDKFKARDSIVGLSLRSIMCGPMKIGENILGLIYVDSQVPTFYFSKKNAEFFEALCSHAAFAVNSARLFNEMSKKIILEEENKHLRDAVKQKKQMVTQLKMELDNPFKELYETLSTMDRNMADQTELAALAKKAKASLLSMKTALDELLGTDSSGKAT